MAKKIVINGLNHLTDISQPWGGINNTEEPQIVYGQEIPVGVEWGMNREEIERFLKVKMSEGDGKIGVQKIVSNPEGTGSRVVSFKTEEDYDTWRGLSNELKWEETGLAYVHSYYDLPSTQGVDVYNVSLIIEEIPTVIQANTNVSINIKGTSIVSYGSGGTDEISETLLVKIQTRRSINDVWVEAGTTTIMSNQSTYTELSLAKYLQSGENYIRLKAVGEYTDSIWRSFNINVVNLGISARNSFELPISGDTLALTYNIAGAVDKRIEFMFGTGSGEAFVQIYGGSDPGCIRNIGTATNTTTGMTFVFDNPAMLNTLLADGVHTVKTRLYVNESVRTPWIENQYIAVHSETQNKYVNINNIATSIDNWSEVTFFRWAAYCGDDDSMQVRFRLTDARNNEYTSWSYSAVNNTMYTLAVQLGIELPNPNVTSFQAYMHIEDENGNELADTLFFVIKNSANNQPTLGADLIIQPSGRDNAEINKDVVINAVNNTVIPSTFTGFNFSTDGWMPVKKDVNDNSLEPEMVRALHIPANRKLTLDYNPFSDFTLGNNIDKNVTLEIDFRVDNVLDETEPILTIGTRRDGEIWGFEMLPLEAYILTQNLKTRDDQNVYWAEGIRTRLTINVVYNLRGINLIRISIDGGIDREIMYNINDRFTAEVIQFSIGNNTSDIDIFSIRCLKKALSVTETTQDYKATLESTSEKLAFTEANNILGDNEEISWSKCLGKYNIIGHTGHLPKYGDENKGKTKDVTLDIKIVGDPDHSGKLTHLTGSGQGTTAMTYYDWNQQYKVEDNTEFISDNGTTSAPGSGYAIESGEAFAKKLVGKINFASSMQSHKIGITRIYTALYKRLIPNNRMVEPSQVSLYPEARLAVYEKPFLFFHRETDSDPWTFKYLMTFGAGKGDKPTFGFDKNNTPNLLMVEGANNDRPLALFRIPWNDDIVYNPDEEAWTYGGEKQLNFGLGKTEEINKKEYPSSTVAINAIKNFFNFVYVHHSGVTYFDGTLSELKLSDVKYNTLVWVTTDDNILNSRAYDLYRYSTIDGTWVDAGIVKLGTGQYEKLNLRTQYERFCADCEVEAQTWVNKTYDNINEDIRNIRRRHFADNASDYIHIDDALFHSDIVKFYAGTDNRAKNTYYYTDPVTLKIRHWQDDVDTTLKTNNVGQQRKPYYVEEHDKNNAGDFYWQGEASGYYNLLEEAFEEDMVDMMRYIFEAMASISGNVMAFQEEYLLSTQDYFPVIAYNEQARLVYENAAVAQASGIYKNSAVQAITQSCGRQRWSEYQWLKDRIMYISSWCEYGEFASSSQAPNGLSWRARGNKTYHITLTPAKWLYPRIGSDSGNVMPALNTPRARVRAGESFVYNPITLDSDSTVFIRGIDYYLDIGDMNIGLALGQGTFAFSGKRLQSIKVNPEGTDTNEFLAAGIEVTNAVNIKQFIVRGVNTISTALALDSCTRLEKIDIRGSSFVGATFDSTAALTELRLPSTLRNLTLNNVANIQTFSIDGAGLLENLHVSGNGTSYGYDILRKCYEASASLSRLTLRGEVWQDPNLDVVTYATDVPNKDVKLTINFLNTNMTFAMKLRLLVAFGNIDDENNDVYVTYTPIDLESITLKASTFMPIEGRQYQVEVIPSPTTANTFKAVAWTSSNNYNASISQNGIITVIHASTPQEAAQSTITCAVTLSNDTVISATKVVKFYTKVLQVGDYVFSDGSYAETVEEGGGLTAIGRCFYINPNNPNDRRMMATGTTFTEAWGVDNTITVDNVDINANITGIPDNSPAAIDSVINNVPIGKQYTKFIIDRRNLLLQAFSLPIPEEQANVGVSTVMEYLLNDIGNIAQELRLYYYPIPSLCYAYEPVLSNQNEQLNAKFKVGNWYMPIVNELRTIRNLQILYFNSFASCEESQGTHLLSVVANGSTSTTGKSGIMASFPVCQF